ncbi:MAG TPA: FtsX-like permease family protein, partial [Pyrinomonadaceae bacterium]|nr:FtsX-like permease family protein [Pyrinomonadaceae bacterium]
FWPNENPLGHQIAFEQETDNWYEIVGVVSNIKHKGLDAREKPELYVSFLQPLFPDWRMGPMYLVVRTSSDSAGMAASVRREVMAIDVDQPVSDVKTMNERIGESLSERRFNMLLLGLFAAVALALASIGIYGVMAYSVAQRTHEIGIRMALGAQAGDILRMMIGQGMMFALVGVALGLIAALALTRLMSSLIFGVTATDPLTFAIVSLVLTAVALVATLIPARRATRVDPMVALRYE